MEETHIAHPTTPIEHVSHTHSESNELSSGFYVASFLILLLILGIFGDMLVFILGLLGAVAIYAGYFTEKAANEEHH
ncbi:hypothetical protein [Persicitalea jodogahamensis]|uniref:Uncharacterized protein n=1 Tax=Persicitalea jodogahamensis TaxID=402147 RepID=A0A8J3G9B6_9BACT|nr:hypothetical protein [Persicitalea jodogahamensis]GHB73300.1 hypothetical protein GCM10007390_29290 [Persicitalea jodogahamensis]